MTAVYDCQSRDPEKRTAWARKLDAILSGDDQQAAEVVPISAGRP